jgi:hypothetical protein
MSAMAMVGHFCGLALGSVAPPRPSVVASSHRRGALDLLCCRYEQIIEMFTNVAREFPGITLCGLLTAEEQFSSADIGGDETIDKEELGKLLEVGSPAFIQVYESVHQRRELVRKSPNIVSHVPNTCTKGPNISIKIFINVSNICTAHWSDFEQ